MVEIYKCSKYDKRFCIKSETNCSVVHDRVSEHPASNEIRRKGFKMMICSRRQIQPIWTVSFEDANGQLRLF